MNNLNDVIKDINNILKTYKKDTIEHNYFTILIKYLKLEYKYQKEVELSGKPIYHYFKYKLPSTFSFEFLYHVYNPIRFAIETFDSIEEIKKELEL
jgi:hypothetical protein